MKAGTQNYVAPDLDRCTTSRQDPAWLARRLADPETRLVPVWRNRNLILNAEQDSASPLAATCRADAAKALLDSTTSNCFLGVHQAIAYFAVDLSPHEETEALALTGTGAFIDLRRIGPLLPAFDSALLAYARGILHWHRNSHYCARCGHPSHSRQGGHVRRCANPDCARENWPRISPAVIMLVEQDNANVKSRRCLLGRSAQWPKGVYSTLAGFVEIGESLEQAVAREVLEESGIQVDDIRYQASQPWPFPASLMLGFRASAVTGEIQVDRDELEDARWFSAEELRQAGDWQDDSATLRLPRRDSISRFLVDCWLNEVQHAD